MNDAHLLEGLRLDEPSAMERMMDKYQVYVYTIIRNVLGSAGNQADAEELVSDTFYAVWQHRGSIQPGKLRSYLCVTARNKAKSFLRSHRELPMDLDTIDLPDGGSSLEDQVIREERARLVRRAIRRMRPKDREIFSQQEHKYAAIHIERPFENPFTSIPNAYKTLGDYMRLNGLVNVSKDVIPCFETDGDTMDIYIACE